MMAGNGSNLYVRIIDELTPKSNDQMDIVLLQ